MTADGSLVRIAVAGDGETAQRWADALTEEGIDAEVHIADAAHLGPGGSIFPAGPSFAYPLLVPADQREAAAAVLVDLGRDGPFGRRLGMNAELALRGALFAMLAGMAIALLALLRGA